MRNAENLRRIFHGMISHHHSAKYPSPIFRILHFTIGPGISVKLDLSSHLDKTCISHVVLTFFIADQAMYSLAEVAYSKLGVTEKKTINLSHHPHFKL